MIELFILALTYINVIDATLSDEDEIHVDGIMNVDTINKIELWSTYQTSTVGLKYSSYCKYDSTECNNVGLIEEITTRQLAYGFTNGNGAFSLSALAPKSSIWAERTPEYFLIFKGQTFPIIPIPQRLHYIAELYSNGQINNVEFGEALLYNLPHIHPTKKISDMSQSEYVGKLRSGEIPYGDMSRPTSDDSAEIIVKNVPEWFRNTAGYWADEQTSNKEFLDAIDYLMNKNVIIIRYER